MKRLLTFLILVLGSCYLFAQSQSFDEVTKQGNKVFIVAPDDASVIHATNALNYWGYWKVVEEKADADFVLQFKYKNQAFGDKKGYAVFIDKSSDKELRQTKTVNTGMSMDFNTKRAVITKIVNKRITKMFE
ncbi:MAG: hypothetical protein MI866_17450 [Bacteroidales bacterium]|nr:hypothetical protein [Bacteroidales bacterium]